MAQDFYCVAPVELDPALENSYNSLMKTATLTETKNNLSALIDLVRQGETILVLDRGRPVARIESAITDDGDDQGRLARLERQGMVRRASMPLPREILAERPPRPQAGGSALKALLEERAADR
jgi:prevent-host-death family protein